MPKNKNNEDVLKRVDEIDKMIKSSEDVIEKLKLNAEAGMELSAAARSLLKLKKEYKEIIKKDKENDSDELPLNGLSDFNYFEKNGKSERVSIEDLNHATSIKKEGNEIIDKKELLISNYNISKIELLQAKLEELLKIID